MTSVKEEIELHISFLEGKLNAFKEASSLFGKVALYPNDEDNAKQVSMAASLIKQELAFLNGLLKTYFPKE